jgi:hypothetical protein
VGAESKEVQVALQMAVLERRTHSNYGVWSPFSSPNSPTPAGCSHALSAAKVMGLRHPETRETPRLTSALRR